MSRSLPDRPDLEQLRRQAKELRDAARRGDPDALDSFARHHSGVDPGVVTLAAAQLVIARRLGFGSWPRLKAAVEADANDPARQAEAFVAASVEGRLREAAAILDAVPDVASQSLPAAAVLGDAAQVARILAADPSAAVTVDEARGWPPLLYACYSRWPQIDPGRAEGLSDVVRQLLDAGASANTNDGARYPRSALKGSVEANNAEMTRILLVAGANPDIGQPIGEAVGRGDHRCLELLLAHGARVAGTWAVGSAVFHDDARAVVLLAQALRANSGPVQTSMSEELPEAAAKASLPVVEALLEAGADPGAASSDGISALRLAVRAGRVDVAVRLRDVGAVDDSTDIDRYIGACLSSEREAAKRILREHPGIGQELTDVDLAVICEVAAFGTAETVAFMLELGFSPHARNDLGEQPLHSAAYMGNAAVVRLLLDAGADVDARDDRFDASPLAFATVGSGEVSQSGDWIEVATLLLDAGASRENVWVSDKPPSEEVITLLRRYGVTPDGASESEGEPDDMSVSLGTGAMADIARHLAVAYRSLDLELLDSLLHPEVRWSGNCNSKAEVLEWYRRLLVDGTRATVESLEVDRDAVVMGIGVAGQAEGARPAPPEHLFQVFSVDKNEIVEIRGYPDRSSALNRPALSSSG